MRHFAYPVQRSLQISIADSLQALEYFVFLETKPPQHAICDSDLRSKLFSIVGRCFATEVDFAYSISVMIMQKQKQLTIRALSGDCKLDNLVSKIFL